MSLINFSSCFSSSPLSNIFSFFLSPFPCFLNIRTKERMNLFFTQQTNLICLYVLVFISFYLPCLLFSILLFVCLLYLLSHHLIVCFLSYGNQIRGTMMDLIVQSVSLLSVCLFIVYFFIDLFPQSVVRTFISFSFLSLSLVFLITIIDQGDCNYNLLKDNEKSFILLYQTYPCNIISQTNDDQRCIC